MARATSFQPGQIRRLLRVTSATSRHPERDSLVLLPGPTAGMRVTAPEAVPPDVVVPCAIELSKQERNALERAIAPATLEHWGWVAEANGRVKTDAGQAAYPASYLTAIQKVLRH